MAPLQKRALYALVLGVVFAIAIAVGFIAKGGVTTFAEDQGFRLIVYGLWIAVPLAYLIIVNLTLRKPSQVDERDRLIIARASKIQLFAVILALIAWMILLTEVYWDERQVPVIFLTLIVLSTLIISTLTQSAAILIGYWKGVSRD